MTGAAARHSQRRKADFCCSRRSATESDEELRGRGAEGGVAERRKGRTGEERAPCSRTRDIQGLVQEGVKGSDGGPGTFSLLRGQSRDQRNGARQAFSLAALNSRDDSPQASLTAQLLLTFLSSALPACIPRGSWEL